MGGLSERMGCSTTLPVVKENRWYEVGMTTSAGANPFTVKR